MDNQVTALIAEFETLSVTALKGCPAETYALMAKLLDKALNIAPLMNQDYPSMLTSVMKNMLHAQEIHDLTCIADFAGFEMTYILKTCAK